MGRALVALCAVAMAAVARCRDVQVLQPEGPDLGEGRGELAEEAFREAEADLSRPYGEDDLGETDKRQPEVDLWTHTDGAPQGHAVSLDLPESGNAEAVAQMVAAKKIEVAAAGLHHARVIHQQLKAKLDRSDEEDETELTRAKIADTKVNRILDHMKSSNEKIERLKGQQGDIMMKLEEAKAAAMDASAKDRKGLEADVALKETQSKDIDTKLSDEDAALKKMAWDIVGAKEEAGAAHDAQHKTQLENIALRVKVEAANQDIVRAQYMQLKSQNMKKLAAADFAKENSKKKQQQGKNDVKSAKEMLDIMASGPGTKEATKSLEKAKKRYEDAKKLYADNTKKVDEVKSTIEDGETKWAKKVAYKAVMKTAQLGSEADAADKAFTQAISEADRNSKKTMSEMLHKELETAEKEADKQTANAMHVEFAGNQSKAARDEAWKEEEEKLKKAEKEAAKQKEEADMAKQALSDTGKSPEEMDLMKEAADLGTGDPTQDVLVTGDIPMNSNRQPVDSHQREEGMAWSA